MELRNYFADGKAPTNAGIIFTWEQNYLLNIIL